MYRPFLVLGVVAAQLSALPAVAGPSHRYLVAEGSSVRAKVSFFGIASKTAHFPRVTGAIHLTPDRPEAIDLDVTIDATALTASDDVTLRRLKGPAFFDVARYPTIRFRGEGMTMTGPRSAEVSGSLTARGITQPTVLKVAFSIDQASITGREPITLTGRATIDRRAFGMTAYAPIVGRKVTITLDARMTPA